MDIALPDGMYYIYRSSRTHKLTILRRPFFTICFIVCPLIIIVVPFPAGT